ncbi:MAG: APC family permease [Candidatus Dormibacterales bacterium]
MGTSVYYVPGILYSQSGSRATLFVAMTLAVFLLLSLKYAEVVWRYPEGGGVVTVSSSAVHPYAGLLGGLLILVDYFLTAALSALSGVLYLAVVFPRLGPAAIPATAAALAGLCLLNVAGIRESARVSLAFAAAALTTQFAVVVAVAARLGAEGIAHSFALVLQGPRLAPGALVTGYASAFLAFSGLESISQIAPAMREPRRRVARRTMTIVVVTIAVTSPLLTLWATTVLGSLDTAQQGQVVSLLGGYAGGRALALVVAVSGSLLLVFASNTAIIGGYHVFVALARMGFLPRLVEKRNRRRGTPHYAILLAAGVPVAVVFLTGGSQTLLGDLYAFGLLGAFTLTAFSLDVVRWRERAAGAGPAWWGGYVVGALTTVLVLAAWCTNLFAKPRATLFGGGLTLAGLAAAGVTTRLARRRGRAAVFPLVHRANRSLSEIRRTLTGRVQVVVILPPDRTLVRALSEAGARASEGRPVAFLFRGEKKGPSRPARPLEVKDPYLEDAAAQDAFALAERMTRGLVADRRYVYVPGSLTGDAVPEIWKVLQPRETLVAEGDGLLLPDLAIDRVRRTYEDSTPVLHLVTRRLNPPA